MRKRMLATVFAVVFLLSALALAAGGATYVDTEATGSLTLTYGYEGQSLADTEIRIYRVAEISQYADFLLTGAFAELPVEVNQVKTQDEWNQVAATLSAYVTAMELPADFRAVTDADGTVRFDALPLGLYLVEGLRVDVEGGYRQFDSFVISVPDLDDTDAWVYDVQAKPKSVFREVTPDPIAYTVNKLWKDEGYSHLRPQSISLELYRDGTLVETVILSAENDWSYSWTAPDDGAVWQVVEADVPEGYTVTLEQKDNFFFVTNGYNYPEDPPKTGDITDLRLPLILMGAAGAGLVVLGILTIGRKKT